MKKILQIVIVFQQNFTDKYFKDERISTYVTDCGELVATCLQNHNEVDRRGSGKQNCRNIIRTVFSSEFLEHRVLEFLINTFCIPLL